MNILELKEFRDINEISRDQLAEILGVSIDTLNHWEYRTKKIPKTKQKHFSYVINSYNNKEIVNHKKEKKVPYYEIDVTSSITSSFNDVVEEPTFYVDYKPFNDCTAYVNNYGDSMFPKYKKRREISS